MSDFVSVIEGVSDLGIRGFETYAEKELLRVFQEHLEKVVDSEFLAIQERLRVQIGDMFKQCLISLLSEYRASICPDSNLRGQFASSVIEPRPQQSRIGANNPVSRIPKICRSQSNKDHPATEWSLQTFTAQANTDSRTSSSSVSGVRKSGPSIDKASERTRSKNISVPKSYKSALRELVPDLPTQAELWKYHVNDDFLGFGPQEYQYCPQDSDYFEMDDDMDPSSSNYTQPLSSGSLQGMDMLEADINKDFDFDLFLQQDQESGDDELNNERHAKKIHSSRNEAVIQLPFACPYRKHDAQKYNVNDWSICALTPQNGIHRVK